MQPINGSYTKHLRPSESANIAPYRPAPALGTPGALVFDPDGDIFVTRDELEQLQASDDAEWDVSPIILEVDEAKAQGHFQGAQARTVLVSIPHNGVVEWLSRQLNRPIHQG